jgi:hypothetical protein
MYTAEQQKSLLNNFIEADKYLRKHRGQFAERNGARLPSTHIVDIRVQQSFYVVKKGKKIKISIMYDIFNVTNLINKRWGKIYTLGTNVFPLINFMGFANQNLLIPQYQFIPFTGNVYSLTTSTMPGSSARWISQVGVKVDF